MGFGIAMVELLSVGEVEMFPLSSAASSEH